MSAREAVRPRPSADHCRRWREREALDLCCPFGQRGRVPSTESSEWRGWEYLDEARRVDTFQRLKEAVTASLAIPADGRALDVGCGTGDDAAACAKAAESVFAIGIDRDLPRLTEAGRRWSSESIGFVAADAHQLPMPAACVDACRSERTLQHVLDPAVVVAELVRVLRPGGRLALTEPDWETCVVAGGAREVSRAVVASWLDRNRNPTVGRHLAGLVTEAGLQVEHLEALAVCYRDLDQADRVFPLRRAAAQASADDLITETVAMRWSDDLETASTSGTFLLSITLFTVVAMKPLD